jgi:hypothetical protein
MFPLPNQPVPLALINATIDKKVDEYIAKQKGETTPAAPVDTRTPAEKQAAAEELAAKMMGKTPLVMDSVAQAKVLISQADALEAQADAKREEAYALVPELKPGRGRPADPEELKAEKLEERKTKRRERDQRKAAEAKVEKKESDLDAKVAAKLKRDAARAAK